MTRWPADPMARSFVGCYLRMLRYLALFLVTLSPSLAAAAARAQCGTVKSQYLSSPVGYCALLPPSYDAQPAKKFPVVYLLHGLGGDHTFLVSTGGWNMIADAWEQKRLAEFVIITPQAGTSFYINSRSGTTKYEDFFIRDFVPQMEKKFRLLGTRSGRAIGGISMGGYGALRLAFKYPQMFVSAAGLMPALMEELPHGSRNAYFTAFFGTAFGSPLDESFWKANSPFVYARTANFDGMHVFLACGQQDNYAFDGGTREMDKLLAQHHVAHETHLSPGEHDWQFVAQYLLESLEYQAKAFAPAR
jgi:S-formylglutathione hydrolase FrmB